MGSVIFINRQKNLCFLGTVQFVVLSNSLHKSSVNSFWRKDSSRFHSVIRIFLENVSSFDKKKTIFCSKFYLHATTWILNALIHRCTLETILFLEPQKPFRDKLSNGFS